MDGDMEPETIYVDQDGNEIIYEEEPVYVPQPRPVVRRVVKRPAPNYVIQEQPQYMQQPMQPQQQFMQQPMNNQYMQPQQPMNNGFMQQQQQPMMQQYPQQQQQQQYQPPQRYQQQQQYQQTQRYEPPQRYEQPQRYQQPQRTVQQQAPVRRQQQQPMQPQRRVQSSAPVRNGSGLRQTQQQKPVTKTVRDIKVKQHPLPASQRISGPIGGGKKVVGTRVSVTNLHDVATADDIEELFENIGTVSNARMVSKGSVVVVFQNEGDAKKAVEVYNNRKLDGQPMQVKVLGAVYQK